MEPEVFKELLLIHSRLAHLDKRLNEAESRDEEILQALEAIGREDPEAHE